MGGSMKVWMLSELHCTLFICTAALADDPWVRVVMVTLAVIAGLHSVKMCAREAEQDSKVATSP